MVWHDVVAKLLPLLFQSLLLLVLILARTALLTLSNVDRDRLGEVWVEVLALLLRKGVSRDHCITSLSAYSHHIHHLCE